jgi:uncharacterized protein (TIGR03435 family)
VSLCIIAASLMLAQSAMPAFEVASVKPSVPGTPGGRVQLLPGGNFKATNVSLDFLIQQIYEVRNYQVVGDQHWMAVIADGESARYEIQAKGDPSATEAQVKEMVKALLAERFQLRVHREKRELPVYALIPARIGIKLQPAKDNRRPRGSGGVESVEKGWVQGENVSVSSLIEVLSRFVDRPVLDKTNFVGAFDFKLTFNPNPEGVQEPGAAEDGGCPASFAAYRERRGLKPEPMSCPSVFTAVQEQLGLKLDLRKDSVDVLVIDHVERPTAN